ncbi:MAG: glucuronate isomerase [Treponema sp.]|nr:glucuronate isomerase [Treponema sp.]
MEVKEMKHFLDENFILKTETAQTLFHKYAEKMPIFDFHNHLSAKEIYEDKSLGNLANAWLDGDHYKWRQMRSYGVPENLVTGHNSVSSLVNTSVIPSEVEGSFDFKRFMAYVYTIQGAVGNPLYHWTHLELQRYFGIKEPLTPENAEAVWNKCNEMLATKDYSVRNLLRMQNVKVLCTTDDPADSLEWHKKIRDDNFEIQVLPSFRPDGAMGIEKSGFCDYIKKLSEVSGKEIVSFADLIQALEIRADFFKSLGSVVSDMSLEKDFFVPCSYEETDRIFRSVLKGEKITPEEVIVYQSYLLIQLGAIYKNKGFVMQLHVGAIRDNNKSLLVKAGVNVGNDSLADFNYVAQVGGLLNAINTLSGLPKTILYNLNPKDNEALATMCGNFWENEDAEISLEELKNGKPSRVQFGPAWWFCDHKDGIEEQLRVYSRTNLLGGFIGMLTDSRSFLSFPRHEYFRRILCNFIGEKVENGEYPWNEKQLGKMVEDICWNNAEKFFC